MSKFEINRRILLKAFVAGGALGASSVARYASADTVPESVVLGNYGGDTLRCVDEVFAAPFKTQYGVPLVQDGSGPTFGKLKAMIDSGQIAWDVIDGDVQNMVRLQDTSAMLPIDYSIVDRKKVMPTLAWDYGINNYTYSYVLAYDTEKLGGKAPSGWADFFDVKTYPGKRAVWKWALGALEAALLGDGVAPEKLYPLDVARAKAKLESIKDDLIVWSSGADSQQLFYRSEVAMAQMWNGRANLAMRDTGGRVQFTFNQGILAPGVFNILNGGPAGPEWANRLIASCQDPELQAAFFRCIGYGPANPAAIALLTEEENRLNPSAPANLAVQVPLDPVWVAAHEDQAIDVVAEVVSA